MSGESMGQDHIRRDIQRRHAHAHLSTSHIAASYAPQIEALDRPRHPMSTPD